MRPDQRDLDDELRGHLALEVHERVSRGESAVDARLAAAADLGYVHDVRESMRRVWYSRWFEIIDGIARDARFAARVLRKSPAFSLTAIVTLALAIAANALVFGVMNGLLLRPIAAPQPESLYGIEHATEHSMYESYPDYRDLRDRNHSFDGLAGFTIAQVGFDTGEETSRLWAVEASGNYFDVLRLQPALGRLFHSSDEHGPGSAPYAVLSYDFWRTHFHGDPSVVGRAVRLNTQPFTIIGVAPASFHGLLAISNDAVYVPMAEQPQIEGTNKLEARASQWVFMTFGHLRPGVTLEQAAADLNSVGHYLETAYPVDHGSTAFRLAKPGLYGNYFGQPMRAFLTGLMLLSALILVGACANLGSLFAARAADRSKEIALRLSLGASGPRVLRQLMTEAVLLSTVGGVFGLWLSVVALRALAVWHPLAQYPITVPVAPDAGVYLMALALAIVSGLLFGLVPARQVLRIDPYQTIKAGPAVVGRRITLRDVLLAAQIAICAVMVSGSLVAVRGLWRAMHGRFGFDPQATLLADTDLSMARYSLAQVPAMQKRMHDAVAEIPGVAAVGVIGRPPLAAGGFASMAFADRLTDLRPANATLTAQRFHISPDYLTTARTVLLAGRPFSSHDDLGAPKVAIVNREFARRMFGSADASVGGFFKLRDGSHLQVIGVVEDGKYATLTEDPEPALFVPLAQVPMSETTIVIRAQGDPQALAAVVRQRLRGLDAGLPVYIETWEGRLDFAFFAPRAATLALGVMGTIGVMLAITGIFGMAAYSVSQRLKELGIRIALGAQRREVITAAVGRAFRLLALGSAAGIVLALLAARILAAIVYQASPRDPLIVAAVVAVMLSLGLFATMVPVQRALSIDPLRLLREE